MSVLCLSSVSCLGLMSDLHLQPLSSCSCSLVLCFFGSTFICFCLLVFSGFVIHLYGWIFEFTYFGFQLYLIKLAFGSLPACLYASHLGPFLCKHDTSVLFHSTGVVPKCDWEADRNWHLRASWLIQTPVDSFNGSFNQTTC